MIASVEGICARIGYPRTIMVDNGSKFISRDMDLWACQRDAFIEAFNGRLRAECLNTH